MSYLPAFIFAAVLVLRHFGMLDDSREMQRLRLEQAARNKSFEARIADEALAQFDERQRHAAEAELVACKRKIQELVAAQPAQKKLKHMHVPGKLDQSLQFFGFAGGPKKAATVLFFCSDPGCDRGFTTVRARAAHMLAHKNSSSRFA